MKKFKKTESQIFNRTQVKKLNLAKKKKYYVVWTGVKPGVYDNWKDCQANISGFEGAQYKSFPTKLAAESAFKDNPWKHIGKNAKTPPTPLNHKGIIKNSLSVDASSLGNPGIMEYRGVRTDTKEEIFRKGPYKDGNNNIGEFLALVHAIALLQKQGLHQMPIYSDSITAMSWVRNKKVKSNLQQTPQNALLFELVERALIWLRTHTYQNPILKWDTPVWGEIPADFGRK
ncbi:MAG TPA: ribonuclease H [Saprospiraceae bacterium]|nr:ribonuclease H [Saprospiraceae bacterium]